MLQDSSFILQNSSFLTLNSSFLIQNSPRSAPEGSARWIQNDKFHIQNHDKLSAKSWISLLNVTLKCHSWIAPEPKTARQIPRCRVKSLLACKIHHFKCEMHHPPAIWTLHRFHYRCVGSTGSTKSIHFSINSISFTKNFIIVSMKFIIFSIKLPAGRRADLPPIERGTFPRLRSILWQIIRNYYPQFSAVTTRNYERSTHLSKSRMSQLEIRARNPRYRSRPRRRNTNCRRQLSCTNCQKQSILYLSKSLT